MTGLQTFVGLDLVTIQVQRPVMVTVRGTDQPDWNQPPAEMVDIPGCSVQPATGSEDRDQRDGLRTVFDLWAPVDTEIGVFDKVYVPNHPDPLMITGGFQKWNSPDLGLAHAQYNLAMWRG